MKYFAILLFLAMMFVPSQINAEPLPADWYEKKYQPKLDRAIKETMSIKEQFDIDIFPNDIVCFDQKKLVLKLSSNMVVCVKDNTAKKLVERNWGIMLREQQPEKIPQSCWLEFNLSYAEGKKPSESSITKAYRTAIMPYVHDDYLWEFIYFFDRDSVLSHSNMASLSDEQTDELLYEYEKLPNVSKATAGIGACT